MGAIIEGNGGSHRRIRLTEEEVDMMVSEFVFTKRFDITAATETL